MKGLAIGAGAVAAGVVLPAAVAENFGPKGPEVDDPRPAGFWEKDAGPWPTVPRLESDVQADVAVIGSGITGLCAALTLRELRPELKLCVLDSHRPGSGASSRNSGHLVAEYHAWESILDSQGPEAAKEWNQFSGRAQAALLDFIRFRNIECNLRPEPLIAAATKGQVPALQKLAARMQAAGRDSTLHQGQEFQEKIGTRFYAAGIEESSCLLMHPGKLIKGILERVLGQGVPVYGNSPVLKVANTDSAVAANLLSTPQGTVAAKQVFFATNAYTPRLGGLLSSRMIPIHVAIVATRPLTPAERERAGFLWANLKEIQTLSRTIGLTPDHRVFLRGIFGYKSFNSCVWGPGGKDYERMERELRERLPYLEGIEVTERWCGPVAMNVSGRPLAGALPAKGQYICACYNGVGMVDGFYHGRLVAHQMLGADHPDLKYLYPLAQAGWIPPEPGRSIGAKAFFYFGL
ncbi:MAG: hypothetical protein A2V67_14110 [Deltaproteobacteria bacterium RBG_13_61_14]|nr:MAG: hypothetical protein A2V67_14110 [Deltaproteobacteria bacterium RBG_13_61_14]